MAGRWDKEFLMAVALGLVPGHSRVAILGHNPDMDTGAHEDVWPLGGIYPWQSAAVTLEILSSSADDAAAGTGARTVTLDGLDGAYEPVQQTITLNGITPVAVPTALLRVNGLRVTPGATGSVGTNVGNITLRVVAGAIPQGYIEAGYGVSRQCVYTVPAGHTLMIFSSVFGINRNTGVGRFATFATMFRSLGTSRLPLEISISDAAPYRHESLELPIPVAEKTDFTWRCTSVSTDSTDITAAFTGVLKDINYN